MFDFDYILHKVNGTSVELNRQVNGFSAVTSVKLTCNHNKVSELELKLSSSLTFSVGIGDTTTARGKKYVCLSNWTEHNAVKETGGDYVIIFFSPEGWMIKANLYHCVETLTEGVYDWTRDNEKVEVGSLKTFGEFLCYNTNLQQGKRLFKLGTFPEGMDSDYKIVSFSADNCLSCLYDICTAYGVRYEVVENPDEDSDYILNFSNTDVIFPYDFTYEKQGGLYSLKINNADEEVYTEFVVKGSEDNLPLDYPHNELWLDETLYPLSTIKLTDKYARWGKSIKEIKLEVRPERVGVVSGVYDDLNSFEDEDLIGAEWSPIGGTIHVVDGPLAGFDFTVSGFDSTTGKVTVDQNTENERLPMPSGDYYLFTEGTKYTITGIPLPQSYLTAAQEKMLNEALPQVDWYGQLRCGVEIGVSPFLMQDLGTELEAGQLLHISKEADEIDKYLRIQSVQYDLSKKRYFNVSQLTVSDFREESLSDARFKAYKMAVQAHEIATKKQKKGDPGEDGVTTYTWIKYSDNADGTGLYDTPTANTKYIGLAHNKTTATESSDPADYTWSLIKGTDGIDGIDGEPGQPSVTYYLVPSVSVIKKSFFGTITPGTISCIVMRQEGNEPAEVTTEKTLKYQLSDGSLTAYSGAVTITSSAVYIDFYLYDGEVLITSQRVLVLKDASDIEYLANGFADGNTYVTNGLVLSEFMGVLNDAVTPAVVAGMAGKDFVLDGETPITSPMMFAGATSAQNANSAKFKVYKDGKVYAVDMYIEGSTRSPFREIVGAWGDEDNMHDNVYLNAGGSWSIPFDLTWDISQSGRKRTIVVYNGAHTLTPPSGMHFFENGLVRDELYMHNDTVEVIGYADSTGFLGWIVLSRQKMVEYFTQAEWNAASTAKKNSVPLAVIGE